MKEKDRIRIKLIMYCLLEIREFVLHQYDVMLCEQIVQKKGKYSGSGMLSFTLRSIIFNMKISESVDNILGELLNESEKINNNIELYDFAEKSIPNYISKLRNSILVK